MKAEIQALEDNKTWEVVSLPPGKKVCNLHSSNQRLDSLSNGVYNAFLQGDLEEEVYMTLPQVVLVYVDDLLITSDDADLISATKHILHQNFKIKGLGELRYFLSIEFARSIEGILLHQRKYALEVISDVGLTGSKLVHAPFEINQKLTSVTYDDHLYLKDDYLLEDPSAYQRLLGRLPYLTITRLDISFVEQCLSQFMQAPKNSHMVVRYIKQSPGLGILMSATSSTQLKAYCDVDWAACLNNRKSVTGYLVQFGDSLISWKFKKQSTISGSSAEAVYRSLASTMADIVWLVGLFD
ncbi:PREDICTED: uncharacterized protein LOC109238291 [Nicotiana attenuata]|uniref:uncharacterized protein LOC109238291 n=1 Tax=Nicotiana attenuata TaxID=49451 RepID=UPI0009049DBF|nr:PREDICTED: uncharacterized protein LOC109238291 [Nicotiana attenuata]